jgi:hypothetical protein
MGHLQQIPENLTIGIHDNIRGLMLSVKKACHSMLIQK